MRALIIDDEPGVRISLGHLLRRRGYEVYEAATGEAGLLAARRHLPEVVFLDQYIPGMCGDSLLPLLVSPEVGSCVMMITGHVEIDQAVRAMKLGAEYFFPKPIDIKHLCIILDGVEERLRQKYESDHYRQLAGGEVRGNSLIGNSPAMLKVQRLISLLSRNVSTPVLITGDSGSGKELVARAIHEQSGVIGPMVEINSASLSESLLESELFGHEKGAFTDASRCKRGLFEVAGNGTIFFDELAEMPLSVQAKLLKVLDTRSFRRVGGVEDISSNARFIGATNRNISDLVKKGLFREDLYFRINVLPITLPPLRDRGDDVLLLANHFLFRLAAEMGRGPMSFAAECADSLRQYGWPGNVRELRNVVERAIIVTEGNIINSASLPTEFRRSRLMVPAAGQSSFPTLQDVEDEHIRLALQYTGNNHSRTASLLGISRSTLHLKMKRLKS